MNRRGLVLITVLAVSGVTAVYALAGTSRVTSPATRAVLPGQIRLAAVGDIAMVANADGGASYFASVPAYLQGDVVLGNLEGTLTSRGKSKCKPGSTTCFAFRAPPSYASLLKRSGFTILNDANNHFYDYGSVGRADTLAALDRLGLRHTGRPGEITVLRIGTTKVAVVGFAPYPWAQDLVDIWSAKQLVHRAAGLADIVVVTMHAGAEGPKAAHTPHGTEVFLGENRGNARAFTHAVIDSGADLVVGSGPHVLRGMEWYRGRLIAYSMGNFVGCHTLSTSGVSGVSGVLHVTLKADGSWTRGDLTPIRLVGCGVPQHDPAEAAHGVVRQLSKQDFGAHAVRVTTTGVLVPPR
jgi:poly-gamma-glutamate capsule biosynthesis protein CapA/YwtB (metallophosphatase superfamily)